MSDIEKKVMEINIQIANNLLNFRKWNRFSRKYISSKIGVTQQQLYKYENAKNTIPIARLFLLAKDFDKDITYFLKNIF